ncbi:MAG: single-stranded DNA-binding protein [Bacilli bacterium]|nr:single-stranded DNA-binding protein [Bacilli bacterium]
MINRVVLVGRLVRDPELKKTNSGSSVVSFTLAVDSYQKNRGERTANFFPCTAWNATAENIAKFLTKGSLVGVDGHLNQRSYQNRDGRNTNVVEVIADSVQFLERKGESNNSSSSYNAPNNKDIDSDESGDDTDLGIDATDDQLPF